MSNGSGGTFEIAQVYVLSAAFGYRVKPLSLPHDTTIRPQQIRLAVGLESLQSTTDSSEAFQVRLRVTTNPEDENALYTFDIEMACLVSQVDKEKYPPQKLVQV